MKLEAPFEFVVEGVVGQGDQTFGFRRSLGPHNRRAISLERKDRKRAGRKEMLDGAAVVRPFVADVDHNGGLAVIPAAHRNVRAFADEGTCTVGGDQ